jgi:hypothetical protein
MAAIFLLNGNLPQGIYVYTLDQLKIDFGFNKHRRTLIIGLEQALQDLKACNCEKIYIDGSFASNCDHPSDYDCCYDPNGLNWEKLFRDFPVFFDFKNKRENQKRKYGGEFFSATAVAQPPKILYLEFFQKDKEDDSPKGIIQINL